MLGAAAFLVATSFFPANPMMASANVTAASRQTPAAGQSLDITTAAATSSLQARDDYSVTIRPKVGGAERFTAASDPNGTIRWPFPASEPISSGFGYRVAPCAVCTSYHEGIDITAGAGAAIGSIADGVVSAAGPSGEYGYRVVVDHVIDGQDVQSVYAHMIAGSITVTVGQHVTVAQTLGLVGSTGDATGPHLHLEVHVGGVIVDPYIWLSENAN